MGDTTLARLVILNDVCANITRGSKRPRDIADLFDSNMRSPIQTKARPDVARDLSRGRKVDSLLKN